MRRLFCHINELGDDAWDALPAMVLLADELVLWAPAATHLEKLHREGKSPIDVPNLLKLIENGIVKVAARRRHIEDREFRNRDGSYPGQAWHSTFDDAIKAIFREEEATRDYDPRVIALENERGYDWADAQISGNSNILKIAKNLLQQHHIPAGTLQRINRNGMDITSNQALRELLRDVRNHEDARMSLNADLAIHSSPFPLREFNMISGSPGVRLEKANLDSKEIRDLFYWISKLQYSGDAQILAAFKRDPNFTEQFWSLLNAGQHPLAELRVRPETS